MSRWALYRGFLRKVVESKIYGTLVLLLILANSILLLFQSTWESPQNKTFFLALEWVFLALFTIELALGVLAHGLHYLRQFWSILDLIVVIAGWVNMLTPASMGLSALRAFRVLRPLRSISRIESVKILVETLALALPSAVNVTMMMIAFWYLLSLIGIQLWSGVLHRRCYTQVANTTLLSLVPDQELGCTNHSYGRRCEEGSVCLDHHTLSSPSFPYTCSPGQAMCPYKVLKPTTYDNIGQSLVINMQFLSQDNWGDVMTAVQSAWADWIWIYFVIMLFMGIIITNLFVGVLYTYFAKLQEQARVRKKIERQEEEVNDSFSVVVCLCNACLHVMPSYFTTSGQ